MEMPVLQTQIFRPAAIYWIYYKMITIMKQIMDKIVKKFELKIIYIFFVLYN